MEQSQRERDELQRKLDLMSAENENLKSALQEKREENLVFKVSSSEFSDLQRLADDAGT